MIHHMKTLMIALAAVLTTAGAWSLVLSDITLNPALTIGLPVVSAIVNVLAARALLKEFEELYETLEKE